MPPAPDNLSYFVQGLGSFSGVFFGVVAGSIVTLLVNYLDRRLDERSQIKNLVFELSLNCTKLESWLEELTQYRNAVNGDSLDSYYGYFRLSSAIGVTTNQLHTRGVLYRYLSHEHIAQLQEAFTDLSPFGENYLNNLIAQRRDTLAQLNQENRQELWQMLKKQVVADINFWEEKLKRHLNALRSIIEALKGTKKFKRA